MANNEALVINSVCKRKDISILLAEGVDELFVGYQDVWNEIKSYYKQYRSVPDISILQKKFDDLESVETTAETAYYLDSLREEFLNARLEKIITKGARAIGKRSATEIIEKFGSEVASLNRFTSGVRDLDLMDTDDAMRHYEALRERAEQMGGSPGIPTGFKSIDSCYPTGMAPGHLIVVIGWPGKGKTWFTAELAKRAWEKGFKPMLISLEMSPENMRDRIYTLMGEGQFSASHLARGEVNIDDFRSYTKRNFADKNGFIVISPEGMNDVTPNVIQGKIDQHKPDLVICDYHQLFSDNAKNTNPTQRGMALSREFKLLATRNQIPLIDITAATQNDVSDRDTAPMMSQVAWSKAIEYDADLAMAVHRNEESGLVDIVGRKNRHGDLFDFSIDWDIDRGILKESWA